MLKKKKKTDGDDLESLDINLLPSELRASEEKDRKSSQSNESRYQLRKPKKVRKRRGFFSWLPIIGGMHWGVEARDAVQTTKDEPATVKGVEHVHTGSKLKDVPVQTYSRTSDEFGAIKPIHGLGGSKSSSVSPRTKRSFKGGISFPGISRLLKRRRKPVLRSDRIPPAESPRRSVPTPPRHYSLLKDDAISEKKTVEPLGEQDIPEIPMQFGGSMPDATAVSQDAASKESQEPHKKSGHRKFRLPRWLDLFSLLGRMTGGGRSRTRVKKVQTAEKVMTPASEHTHSQEMERPAMPSISTKAIEPIENLAAEEKDRVRMATPSPAPPPRPITPEEPHRAPHRRARKALSIPKWLDIFYWLGLLAYTKKPSAKRATMKPPKHSEPLPVPVPGPPDSAHRDTTAPELVKSDVPVPPSSPITPVPTSGPDLWPIKEPVSPVLPVTPRRQEHTPIGKGSRDRLPPIAQDATQEKHDHKRKEHVKRSWKIPKWLDLFYWLKLLTRKKHKEKKKVPQPVRTDEPEKKPLPRPPVPTPSTTPVVTKEAPPDIQKPQVSLPPELVTPEGSNMPIRGLDIDHATSIVTPRDTGITPVPPEGEEPKKKTGKKHTESSLHVPSGPTGDTPRSVKDVNLIPGELTLRSWNKLNQMIVISVVATIFFIGAVFGALKLWEINIQTRTDIIDTEIERYRDDILVYSKREPEMSAIGDRVELINQLLSRHIYWTNFFELLERFTLPDVYYDSLAATTNGQLSFAAHGKNFETVSRLLRLLATDEAAVFVSDATVSGASLSGGPDGGSQVSFTLELTLNPNLGYYGTLSQ